MIEANTDKKFVNPLDELFQTAPTQSVVEYEAVTEGELAAMKEPGETPADTKDAEDALIDSKIDAVYDAAMDAFNTQTQYTEIVEPRYAARNAEVAANFLNIALNAAATRARVKGDRKRNSAFVPYAGGGQGKASNVVVASREDIMRMISVDAETKELK
jgi:hypothetical protein